MPWFGGGEGGLVVAFFMRPDWPGLLFREATLANGGDASPSRGTILAICPASCFALYALGHPHAGGENSACILT